ncbi:acid phosphatase [Sphingomonas gilva]|uniref:Acid phosphatase n=1 Tax=Sphingomonas gilva TaxID=2305907 RepID=A0A396RM29_9SPHN|nr:HAD family acid phosphatase [Sphingomonas gilva]RHW17398.1 acid phosphatase [Sphingomonas gilva]
MIRLLALCSTATLLSGCVAAAIPLAATGTLAGKSVLDSGSEESSAPAAPPEAAAAPVRVAERPPASASPAPKPAAPSAPPASAAPLEPASAMRYLYGSGEAAATGVQAYNALGEWLASRAQDKIAGRPAISTVLAKGATLDRPGFVPCDGKPLAVVFDIDETVLLNVGFEGHAARTGAAYDEARWQRWEQTGANQVSAVPGAREAIEAARRAGIAVVFNSNRSAANAAATAAALEGAGLGSAVPGDTLWLREDGAEGGKDERRWRIADKYCVVALVGDQLGDFSDLFNTYSPISARRAVAVQPMVAPLWGSGWFILPNPVYGSGVAGGFDQVFPADKRWSDPMGDE